MKKEKLSNIQQELLRLLKDTDKALKKYGISYYACGGTMIGAIREKGFVPWDDDIDLFMTRPEYEKLMEIARKNDNKIGEHLYVACGEIGNSLLPFCKIFDKRYALNDKGVEGDEDYLFIDIFPLDAVPDDAEERATFFKEVFKQRKLVTVSRIKYSYLWTISKNKLLFFPKVLVKTYVNLKGREKVLRKYLDLCKKYEFGTTTYTNSNIWGKGEKENIHTDKLKPIPFPFEDTKINVFEDYDWYLTNDYGDYMTRPEHKDRETHEIEIIKVQED